MLNDWTTYGVISLLIAVAALIATFVASYFLLGARLAAEVTLVTPFNIDSPASSLSIAVLHNGQPVDRKLFVLFAAVENTGRADVVQSHFVDPLEIGLPATVEILSAEPISEAGIGSELETTPHRLKLRWKILKPKETIRIRAILASSDGISADEIWRQSTPIVRLIDVKTGQSFFKSNPNAVGMIAATLFGLFALYFFGNDNTITPSKNLLVAQTTVGVRSLSPSRDKLKLCEISDKVKLLQTCKDIPLGRGLSLLRTAAVGAGYTGKSWGEWFWVAVMVLVNANSGWILFKSKSPRRRPKKLKRAEGLG